MNLAISYGGGPSQAAAAPPDDVIQRIRSIDDTSLGDVAGVFGVAARNVVKRFPVATEPPAAVRERGRNRELNVVFLDLCAELISGQNRALSPLHWGYWPANAESTTAVAADYDPFWAYSENLLAYVPQGVRRVMDVGCGLGANTRLLAERELRVTAVTPVSHHRDRIEQAKLPGVDVRCARFEEMQSEESYDLLLFSESVNHFALSDGFLEHCKTFLGTPGFLLIADDLTEERACRVEQQRVFRVLRAVDISKNVAPTGDWWVTRKRAFAAYGTALMSILEMHDPPVAARVRQIIGELDSSELRVLFSEDQAIPVSKGRYMVYLLQRD